ncbi:hypothetical protein MRX96_052250 [Rhipicephalus microplus]
MWRTSAAKKRSLQLYLEYKQAPDREPFYRGDRESALLFQARTGSLPTREAALGTVRHGPVVPPMRGHGRNHPTYPDGLPATRERGTYPS